MKNVVQSGDNLASVAVPQSGTLPPVQQQYGSVDVNPLVVGQALGVPGTFRPSQPNASAQLGTVAPTPPSTTATAAPYNAVDVGRMYAEACGIPYTGPAQNAFSSSSASTYGGGGPSEEICKLYAAACGIPYPGRAVSTGGAAGVAGGPAIGTGAGGGSLAAIAQRVAASSGSGGGMCLKFVQDALDSAGLSVARLPSAYQLADVLAADGRFKELKGLSDAEIARLGPGAIVVSDPYNIPGNPHGHIAITLGDGREASDIIQPVATSGNQRVFVRA